MVKPGPLPKDTLSKNLAYLLKKRDWSEAELARRSGVSQKAVNNAINGVYRTKVDTCARMAAPFDLTGWDLIRPTLIQELESGGASERLMDAYFSADDEGKKHILQVAEREAKYKTG